MAFKFLSTTRCFSSSAVNMAIKNVTVIGSGLMGSGIAQVRKGIVILITPVSADPEFIIRNLNLIFSQNLLK